MRLKQMQQNFASALLSDDRQITDCLMASRFTPNQLVQLYRNNFYISLGEILSDTFPVVRELVGDEFFAQLGKAYIKVHPPTAGSVTHFGQQLPDYIGQIPQTQALPYLGDIAHLEWERTRLGNQWPVTKTFPFEKLGTLSTSQWPQVIFKLSANVTLLNSNFAILDIFNGVRAADIDNVDINKPQQILLTGSAKTNVSTIELTADIYRFLSSASEGKPLTETTLPADFETILTSLISDGVIDDFEHPE